MQTLNLRAGPLVVILTALLGLLAPRALAQVTYPTRPAEGQFVADLANLISDEDEAAIKKSAAAFLQAKGIPIIVVTINSLAEYNAAKWPIERYALNLFSEWGIGDATRNTGVLLLTSKGDRKVRIEMGGGFTHERDVAAAEIINRVIVPRFKQGDFSRGIREGVEAITTNIDNPRTAMTPGAQGGTSRSAAPTGGPAVPPVNPMGTIGGKGIMSALGCFIIPIGLIVVFMIFRAFTRKSGGGAVPYGPGANGPGPGPAGWAGGWGGGQRSSGLGGMLGGLALGGLLGNAWGSRNHGSSSSSSSTGFGGFGGGGGGGGFGGGGFSGGGGSFGGGFSGGGGATGSW